jgi:hypothetical protein
VAIMDNGVAITCGFCGNDVFSGSVFTGVEAGGGRPDNICCDCVLDLYVIMTGAQMRPLRAGSNQPRSSSQLNRRLYLCPRGKQ